MALTFPLSLEAFFARLPVTECTFHLPANVSVSRTRGGGIRTATRGVRLWTGQIVIPPRRFAQAAGIEALISVLTEAGRSFLAHPLPLWAPISDPSGALLAGSSPVIYALQEGGRELRIAGLPVGFALTSGDMLGWTYGSNPTRYALHQVVTPAIAAGTGITPLVEVTPPIRPGATTGTSVTLVKPPVKAVLIPGQGSKNRRRVFTEGLTLDFIQTLS
ncbi:hypothetical protein [Pararhodobacter aggregans]|uniref:hypothetical protein n=1 Tax=Pararhodobacter aggregans TaxID=404875 RepID=UPI003A92232B